MKGTIIGGAIVLVIIVGLMMFSQSNDNSPGRYDGFAQCLKDKGAIFYGAFWCPHCQKQKALFGKSAKLLPYVECSTPDGGGQLNICKGKGVSNYPTWSFADQSTTTG